MELITALSPVAWPLVAVICIVTALWMFKAPVTRLLDRASKLNLPGLGSVDAEPAKQIEAQAEAQKQLPLPAPQPSAVVPSLPQPVALLAAAEAELSHRLQTSFPNSIDAQLAWAIRTAVSLQLERDHEATYRIIFGSQIAALKDLNVRGSLKVGEARRYYERAKELHAETYANFAFDQWGAFFLVNKLVELQGEGKSDEDRITLTLVGKDFLHFIVGRSLSEHKPF